MDMDKLNKEQREAVLYTEGPLLILAGAGSGKTRVLTHKVAYLVKAKNISPFAILAITFTNKAAKEMKDRIFSLVGNIAYNIQISTFHSFGLKIIRENYKYLNLSNNFSILDEDDSITIIKKILEELNLDPKYYNPKAIKHLISNAKNELIDPEQYARYVNNPWDKIVLNVYKKYQEVLIKNNSVDFDDLLMLPIILFEENKEILTKYQDKYQYVLIDEYQDTNEAQYVLSKMICAKYKNICVVGDGDQSIYSFRGANYNNILNFEKDYPNAKVILLEENYRSTKTILNAANNVIKNNKLRKDKNLWTEKKEGDKIKYYLAFDEKDEALYVVKEIKKLIEEGFIYNEIVVLYRTNAQSRVIEEAFLKENIPYKVIGGYNFYSRKEIKDLVAYMKLIHNEKDNISLLRIINTPKRGIGPKIINNLIEKADLEGKSIYEVIDGEKEQEFKNLIEELKNDSKHLTLTELVDTIMKKSGIKEDLENEGNINAKIRLENLEEFKSITKAFEERHGVISLAEFLMEISLISSNEEVKEEKDKVSLMTVHAVKGLEFNIVFIVGLEEGLFPHVNSFDNLNDLEEERRLFYVGVTRAKEKLYLINARNRLIFGNRRNNETSRFIREIEDEYIEYAERNKDYVKIESDFYDEVEYIVGDKVFHDKYGEGVIIDLDDSLLTIAFTHDIGIKIFMKNHKSIRKI